MEALHALTLQSDAQPAAADGAGAAAAASASSGSASVSSSSCLLNVNIGILGHVDSGKTSLGQWKCNATAEWFGARLAALVAADSGADPSYAALPLSA